MSIATSPWPRRTTVTFVNCGATTKTSLSTIVPDVTYAEWAEVRIVDPDDVE